MFNAEGAWLYRAMQLMPAAVLAVGGADVDTVPNSRAAALLGVADDQSLSPVVLRAVLPHTISDALDRVQTRESNYEEGEAIIGGRAVAYYIASVDDAPGVVASLILFPRVSTSGGEHADFLSFAAHELKTPLTAIKGGAQLLRRRFKGGARTLEARDLQLFDMLSEQVDRLAGMVDNLLETSRLSGGRIHTVVRREDMREVVAAAVARHSERRRTNVVRFYDKVAAPVTCDRTRVIQVMDALLQNAADHSHPGDPILVELKLAPHSEVQVSVCDRGPGISPSDQPHVFERFYRGAGSSHGLGLGMYIAAQLVALQGGRIWVENDPGVGTNVSFTLPEA